MKLNALGFSLLATVVMAIPASGQVIVRRGHVIQTDSANRQGIQQVQQDLINAISAMKVALPIYDGHRVHSIGVAYRGLVMVDKGLYGTRAKVRAKPQVTDEIASKTARSKYSDAQIGSSQTQMQLGLEALNQASSDLQKAVNGNYGKKGQRLATWIQEAIADANSALSLHKG